ncbi:MAG: PEP-CTERM sorting domain-containing protein [Rhodocyclaceae bacterium]|nr:PEP-CTERM sorting domain-containing protein [Rhodocyclaceae bacterium]
MISTLPRFQPPPRQTQHAVFPALRFPVCFVPDGRVDTNGKLTEVLRGRPIQFLARLSTVPEPSSLALSILAVVVLTTTWRRRRVNPEILRARFAAPRSLRSRSCVLEAVSSRLAVPAVPLSPDRRVSLRPCPRRHIFGHTRPFPEGAAGCRA